MSKDTKQTVTATIYQGEERVMAYDGGPLIDGLFQAAHHLSPVELAALIALLQAAEPEINTRFR